MTEIKRPILLNKRNRPYDIEPNYLRFSIDRSSPLGNPFFLKDESQRDKVCNDYTTYFYDTLAEKVNMPFIDELADIRAAYFKGIQIYLECWCAPKRCHGETIIHYLENAAKLQGVLPYTIPELTNKFHREIILNKFTEGEFSQCQVLN